MDIKEVLDLMHSDFKLWERATSEDLGEGVVAKTITLPWGIGEYTVNMEGMNDANKRREAVAAFGNHIRDVIEERIDDEAITSRAQAAAARAKQDDSGHRNADSQLVGIYDEAIQETDAEDSTEAHQGTVEGTSSFGDDFAADRAAINGRINELTRDLARLCRQLRGIDAAIAAMKENDD